MPRLHPNDDEDEDSEGAGSGADACASLAVESDQSPCRQSSNKTRGRGAASRRARGRSSSGGRGGGRKNDNDDTPVKSKAFEKIGRDLDCLVRLYNDFQGQHNRSAKAHDASMGNLDSWCKDQSKASALVSESLKAINKRLSAVEASVTKLCEALNHRDLAPPSPILTRGALSKTGGELPVLPLPSPSKSTVKAASSGKHGGGQAGGFVERKTPSESATKVAPSEDKGKKRPKSRASPKSPSPPAPTQQSPTDSSHDSSQQDGGSNDSSQSSSSSRSSEKAPQSGSRGRGRVDFEGMGAGDAPFRPLDKFQEHELSHFDPYARGYILRSSTTCTRLLHPSPKYDQAAFAPSSDSRRSRGG